MKLEIKDSANYAPEVVVIPEPFKLPNSDRLVGMSVQGFTIVGDLSWQDRGGQLALFFPAEVQVSEDYAFSNNLHRHTALNADPTESGYLEDNRRIRALKLRGTVSNGMLMPLTSLEYLTVDPADLKAGDKFDTIDGVEISRKYRIKEPQVHDRNAKQVQRAFKRIDSTMLPEHFETEQYLRNEHYFTDDDIIIVTQKLHGTSARFANTIVKRQLKWYERLAEKLGIPVAQTEYDTVAGSRRSIKDPNNPAQQHFYGDGEGGDVWTEYLRRIEDKIPQGFIVYGEIIGFTRGGGAIQKGHTYDLEPGENELYVYRVAFINPTGMLVDLGWDQVRKFTAERGMKHTPELWRGFKRDFELDQFVESNFYNDWSDNDDRGYDIPVPLGPGGTGADEGIAIRLDRDGLNPLLFKYKNDSHYLYETAQLDSGEEDIESQESA